MAQPKRSGAKRKRKSEMKPGELNLVRGAVINNMEQEQEYDVGAGSGAGAGTGAGSRSRPRLPRAAGYKVAREPVARHTCRACEPETADSIIPRPISLARGLSVLVLAPTRGPQP